ncbi:MAG: hypothetical protein ACLQU9_03375 [Acidimicrobiales bacterium]|jgi:hypothetical protein
MKESIPGPGWEKGTDGRWHPDWLTYADFRGAAALSAFFKVFAVVVVAAGVVAAVLVGRSLHADGAGGDTAAVVVGIIGGSVVAAAAIAFFGFVLELLIAIHFGVRFSDSAREAARRDQVSS